MANAPSIKGLAVSIMACISGIMWKVPITLHKEPSIRSLAPVIATRALNMMVYEITERDSTRDLIGQKPMVYYTGKPIQKPASGTRARNKTVCLLFD